MNKRKWSLFEYVRVAFIVENLYLDDGLDCRKGSECTERGMLSVLEWYRTPHPRTDLASSAAILAIGMDNGAGSKITSEMITTLFR